MQTKNGAHSFKHTLLMMLGCVVPFLLLFLLPLFGVRQGASSVVFFVLMLGCHLMMMGSRGSHGHHERDREI
jgi:hypothetical protein